jgi:hypothetical protein
MFLGKLEAYGFDDTSRSWFKSFLCNRRQRVAMNGGLSGARIINVGCPQGSILSPTCFILFCADLEAWLEHVSIYSYADDTTTSYSHENYETVQQTLNDQAENVLNYIAANNLVVNPQKTSLIIIRKKGACSEPVTIHVGPQRIEEKKHVRVLGIIIANDLGWKMHVSNLKNILNSGLFLIRRLENLFPETSWDQWSIQFSSHTFGMA